MAERLHRWASRVRESLWLVPGLMVVASIVLAVAMVLVDRRVSREVLIRFPLLFGAGAESSREMLATIAGSMITVAGVTFSITIVAVAQASSQYSPRVLRNFMHDRRNQVVLGVLAGVFTYCLVVLRTIRSDTELLFIPALSIVVAIAMAIAGIGFLIYFIHHIAESLQADNLLANIRKETLEAVDRLFPQELGEEAEPEESERVRRTERERRWIPVGCRGTGYIQRIDAEAVIACAREHRVLIRMERGIGDFVVEGVPIVSVAEPGPVTGTLRSRLEDAFTIEAYRTVEQDVAFGIRQMVDVALKALSPGINDPTTAVSAIDHLSAVMARVASRRVEEPVRRADGKARVIARGPSFAGLLDASLDEIRRNVAGHVSVMERMLTAIETIAAFTRSRQRRLELRRHAELVGEAAERTVPLQHDRLPLVRRAAELAAKLD